MTHATIHWALRTLAMLGMALFFMQAAHADPPGRVGRVADSSGIVWIYDGEQGEWIHAARNRPVTTGDRLSTERDSRVQLQIGSVSLRLDGNTEVEFLRLDDERVQVQLNAGSASLRPRSRDSARDFEIVTPQGRFTPAVEGLYRVDRFEDASAAAAVSGELRFDASDSNLTITAGQRFEIWQEGSPMATHYTNAQVRRDDFGDWVVAEEQRDDRSQSTRYVSTEMTGWEDLDRHGRWDSHPDYGTVWYPQQVVTGWAPYRYGRWTHVQPWGWTWVDDAPWGFAPFHYGRWVSHRGRWCWVPGSYVARPVYAPALVGWVGGSHVSVGISVGGPMIGWVPLAPYEAYWPRYRYSDRYFRNVNGRHAWEHRQPDRDRRGPIMYTNRGVPGGVTVVPANALRDRQRVTDRVVRDPRVVRTIAESRERPELPAPPPARVVARPGEGNRANVPPAPGRSERLPRVIEARRDRPDTPGARLGPDSNNGSARIPASPQGRDDQRNGDRQVRRIERADDARRPGVNERDGTVQQPGRIGQDDDARQPRRIGQDDDARQPRRIERDDERQPRRVDERNDDARPGSPRIVQPQPAPRVIQTEPDPRAVAPRPAPRPSPMPDDGRTDRSSDPQQRSPSRVQEPRSQRMPEPARERMPERQVERIPERQVERMPERRIESAPRNAAPVIEAPRVMQAPQPMPQPQIQQQPVRRDNERRSDRSDSERSDSGSRGAPQRER